jgi:signal transduction histidine kinase
MGRVHWAGSYPPPVHLPPLTWLQRLSPWQIRLVIAGVAIFVFCVSMLIDSVMFESGVHPLAAFSVSDAIAAGIAAWFAAKAMERASERRRLVHERLHMIAEMNHHIRNALTVIQMSARSSQDEEAIKRIDEEIARIEWVLREILEAPERRHPSKKP